MVVFCCQSAAILRHLLYHIGNFHPLFTRHVVGSVGDVGLLLRFPCFSELGLQPKLRIELPRHWTIKLQEGRYHLRIQ